ncbi:7-carboxy-7-deazaguanine synthase [Sphingomonas solaris]|uniref:7-carboxy-7-deazaguanine synthase n=1 Tax=Alterirhizorhabdus solaris TaxID=2529389 RepID=A0A558R6T2_9SPHN|nr:7-carboxy-7-deazaguanine synthase [Sphingomonas solaris]TVV75038.1 7-carboxy-7-deazaguanine synthase [Sphingomonas solaris]
MAGYAVKEMFLTLQGEGMNAGRRALFIRFTGCNLWSGREADRATADCRFCDTDFVGFSGDHGGRYADAAALVERAATMWAEGLEDDSGRGFVVLTGGEPLLQVDAALTVALAARGFEIAVETNGTQPRPPGVDWLCVSPKAGTEVVLRAGDELKIVWPQPGLDYKAMESWDFTHHLVSPMDGTSHADTQTAAIRFVIGHPRWRLSTQTHKTLGLR